MGTDTELSYVLNMHVVFNNLNNHIIATYILTCVILSLIVALSVTFKNSTVQ